MPPFEILLRQNAIALVIENDGLVDVEAGLLRVGLLDLDLFDLDLELLLVDLLLLLGWWWELELVALEEALFLLKADCCLKLELSCWLLHTIRRLHIILYGVIILLLQVNITNIKLILFNFRPLHKLLLPETKRFRQRHLINLVNPINIPPQITITRPHIHPRLIPINKPLQLLILFQVV